jgi:hypothetical protein
MTRAKWLDALTLENISPLLDECATRAEAYEIFHAMACFHQTLIAEIWLRFGIATATPIATVSRPPHASAAAALAALESLGVTVMSMETLTSNTGQEYTGMLDLLSGYTPYARPAVLLKAGISHNKSRKSRNRPGAQCKSCKGNISKDNRCHNSMCPAYLQGA